ncbi:MAG TPA: enoyl-CoA hydratase-related protein [Sphingobium sp.]|uniref:enoyl-CoA hydratase-related protein n=1 Tax=Sphingobium sp. TaxID=1912891 RepID=UPI002ED304F1
MSDLVKVVQADGILTLILDRPAKKNALTDAMYCALADAMAAAEGDPAVRVILFLGEGSVFSAGNDIAEFATKAGDGLPGNVVRFLRALAGATKPLIAAVQGMAVGIGATLLLHCDYVVLAEDAQLVMPFVNLALVPEAASSLLLPARIGHVRAFAMFALGEAVTAGDAVAWGLANSVVPVADLPEAAQAVALRLSKQPRSAITATKALMRSAEAIVAQMEAEEARFAEQLRSPEAQAIFAAFLKGPSSPPDR